MRICFTGGGTGGHVYPALAVIQELERRYPDRIELFWIGSRDGVEKEILLKLRPDIPYYPIPAGKLRRYLSVKNLSDIFRVISGTIKAWHHLGKIRPAVLMSKGGFVSVPAAAAAYVRGIPVITHESDCTPGLATRIISRFARQVLIPYESSKQYYPGCRNRCVVTGNPVRREILEAVGSRNVLQNFGASGDKPVVLVLGGSQGALEINEIIWQWAEEGIEDIHIIHQCGRNTYRKITADNYTCTDHIGAELGELMASVVLIISRAGAGAIWEIARAGTAMILVPKTDAGTRGDQLDNAELFTQSGAAQILYGSDLNLSKLKSMVNMLIGDETLRKSMIQSAQELTTDDSVRRIADIIACQEGRR
jgi:UDP-N-acetylglucosamine--N-acetylmuramyl-(pentapeptide) pyrophosphoryl-undecaprenol N-acetylglucosamine transferase